MGGSQEVALLQGLQQQELCACINMAKARAVPVSCANNPCLAKNSGATLPLSAVLVVHSGHQRPDFLAAYCSSALPPYPAEFAVTSRAKVRFRPMAGGGLAERRATRAASSPYCVITGHGHSITNLQCRAACSVGRADTIERHNVVIPTNTDTCTSTRYTQMSHLRHL